MAKYKKLPTEVLDRLANSIKTEKLHSILKQRLSETNTETPPIHTLNSFFNRELTNIGGKAGIARIHLLVSVPETAWLNSFDKYVLPTLI